MTGRFRKGRPYVVATIVLPRLNLCGNVEFMLDTGADLTLLSPADAMRMGYCFDDMAIAPLSGWGGTVDVALEDAIVAFSDITAKMYGLNIGIVNRPPDECRVMPSVIGMDLLSRWKLKWEPREDTLEIELKHADWDELGDPAFAEMIQAATAMYHKRMANGKLR